MTLARWRVGPGRNTWRHHPGVRSVDELTFGERAADRLRNGMGSWGFVFAALLFLAGWMAGLPVAPTRWQQSWPPTTIRPTSMQPR